MKTYVFHIDKFTPIAEGSNVYSILTLRVQGATPQEALAAAPIPEGHKMWCWWVDEAVESK